MSSSFPRTTRRPGMPSSDAAAFARARTILTVLFAVAVAVSVVHYTDNSFNYHDYPRSSTLPNPSEATVATSWFVFTACGVAMLAFALWATRRFTVRLHGAPTR